MAASETCARCGQEVRWGWRDGREAYWHREQVDHVPVFGRISTPEDKAELERQLDLPRERFVPTKTGFPLLFTIETYTTRQHDIAKIKDKAKREAAEAEEEITHQPIPEPEVRSTPIEIGDSRLPGGAKSIINLARKHEWTAWATYARGPRTHSATGALLEISDSILVRMRLDGGERWAVASWLSKNGKPGFQFAYILSRDESGTITTTAANSDELKAHIRGE